MWAGLFSLSTCCMVYIRQREDPINSIVGGFTTGFILAVRGGFRRALGSGIFGGVFLGVIEGVMVIHTQYQKRASIVKENKDLEEMKKEMQRAYGFKPSI